MKEKCPICGSTKYDYTAYHESIGTVEQHGFCPRCGYRIEQAYCIPIVGFMHANNRGHRNTIDGKYYANNVRHYKRMRRKYGIKYGPNDRILEMI